MAFPVELVTSKTGVCGLEKAGGPQLRLAKARTFRVPLVRVVRAIRKLLPAGGRQFKIGREGRIAGGIRMRFGTRPKTGVLRRRK